MPKVLNKRTDVIPPNAVYVGRPSKWGNPFKMMQGCTREQSLMLYNQYLEEHPELVKQAMEELRGKDLVCWCAPLPCHANILLELANR